MNRLAGMAILSHGPLLGGSEHTKTKAQEVGKILDICRNLQSGVIVPEVLESPISQHRTFRLSVFQIAV